MKVEPRPRMASASAKADLRYLKTVVHLIVGPARDERCVVLSLSCGARLRPGYPQHYCTLRFLLRRPAWRYRRSSRSGKSRATSGYTATSSAVVRQRADIIQLPPTTPGADRT